jgi:hypothetical protein
LNGPRTSRTEQTESPTATTTQTHKANTRHNLAPLIPVQVQRPQRRVDVRVGVSVPQSAEQAGLSPVREARGSPEHSALDKGPEVLESTRRVDTVILDKTGTVTTGRMLLQDEYVPDGVDRTELLRMARALEYALRSEIDFASRSIGGSAGLIVRKVRPSGPDGGEGCAVACG